MFVTVGSLLVVLLQLCACTQPLFRVHSGRRLCPLHCRTSNDSNSMPQLSAEAKHHILLEYSPHSTAHSFAALAARHSIAGGRDVVRRWHDRWDGTVQSLERNAVSGRPRALNSRQVQQYVRTPILRANRAHRAVHYPQLLPCVRQKSDADLSLRTLQRYGHDELHGRQTRGKKRTAEECESACTCAVAARSLCVSHCF